MKIDKDYKIGMIVGLIMFFWFKSDLPINPIKSLRSL